MAKKGENKMLKDRILFVGIGQGGGNITKEFEDLGYKCFYVNTSYEDLKTLNVDENRIYHIANAKGCAKNREKAQEYAVGHYDDICNVIDSKFPTYDIIFIVNGAGGGTSGMSYILMDIMANAKNTNKKYNVITALPNKQESILVHNNAAESLKQLRQVFDDNKYDNIRSLFLLDNNKRADFLEINSEFAMLFDRFFSYTGMTIKGNLDGEELETLMLDRGISVITEFENDDFNKGVKNAVSRTIFADWNLDCKYAGAILNKDFSNINVPESMKDIFGIPITDFKTYDDQNGNIIVATGMSFNKGLINKLANVTKEKFMMKKEVESAQDDTEEEIAVDLDNLLKKPGNKKVDRNPKDTTKELMDILNKYKK
jgi:cell division GTPase FtsZ